MIGVQTPLGEQLFHGRDTKVKSAEPNHGQENHLLFKLAPLEQTGN
jgi:hypothetical protein